MMYIVFVIAILFDAEIMHCIDCWLSLGSWPVKSPPNTESTARCPAKYNIKVSLYRASLNGPSRSRSTRLVRQLLSELAGGGLGSRYSWCRECIRDDNGASSIRKASSPHLLNTSRRNVAELLRRFHRKAE